MKNLVCLILYTVPEAKYDELDKELRSKNP